MAEQLTRYLHDDFHVGSVFWHSNRHVSIHESTIGSLERLDDLMVPPSKDFHIPTAYYASKETF